jgi:neutral ceramidase
VNAEVYNLIAQQMKKASPMTNTVMITLANGRASSGYIINDEAYGRHTFQVLGNRIQPGHVEQGIINGLVNLIKQYMNGSR